uniref:Uncharacterized protein n=1 Tax=Anguilla anguilla TaxID=7936 RepID=A0A0E9UU10_ANGAN
MKLKLIYKSILRTALKNWLDQTTKWCYGAHQNSKNSQKSHFSCRHFGTCIPD